MPTQHEKLAAFAAHLLDGYLGLREKWEVLDPVQSTAGHLRPSAMPGFRIIRRTLLFATILDAANLCCDKFDTTPSLANLDDALAHEAFKKHARKRYAEMARLPPPDEQLEPSLALALRRHSKQRVQERAAEFDTRYAEFSSRWGRLRASEQLGRVTAARDRVVAHVEIHYVKDQYAPVDLAALGLSFAELSNVVMEMQSPIDLAQQLLRSAGFD